MESTPRPAGPSSPRVEQPVSAFLAALRPHRHGVDWIAIAYTLLSGFYPLLNPACFEIMRDRGSLHAPYPHLLLHLALAAAIFVVLPWLRRQGGWPRRLLALVILPLMFGFFYAELEFLGVVFRDHGDSFDPLLIDLEERIFGYQPSLEWSRAWPWPWFLEVMEFAYFSYYFFAVIGLVLIWKGAARPAAENWALSEAMVRDLVAVMLSCYAWYTFFPVWGPKYFEYLGIAGPVETEGLNGYVFTDIMRRIHATGALQGAAFPSSHVAGSMVSWWWGWKAAPRHRWWFTTLWVLLCLSIVYCRYHYVVDLVAGVAWGALIMGLTGRFMRPPDRGPGPATP
jgi:membrane-associated phospholipid phosphatase